jgi:hypothetical protein
MNKPSYLNVITYFLFLLIAFVGIVYGNSIMHHHAFLRVWSYQNLLLLLVGVPFLFLQQKAAIPDFFDKTVSNQQRFLHPALVGAVFGILDIIVIKCMLHPEPYTELPPFLQPFPYAIFLYLSGAFELEVFYRLIPLTLFMLLGRWIARGKYVNHFFWIAAVLTALREPLEQWPQGNALFISYALLTGFAMNFVQAVYFRKSGFLASFSLRLGHYLFWHILLGIYVEFYELTLPS